MRVMIVEDEPLLRQGLISKINWEGLDMELAGEASNGFEALEALERCRPDIVLTDVRMPGMDGLQFISKAHDEYPAMKFVIISGFNEFEYAREAMKHNVKDYLLKPVDEDKLHSLLADMNRELCEEQKSANRQADLEQLSELFLHGGHQALDYQLTRFLTEGENRWHEIPRILASRDLYAAVVARIDYASDKFKEGDKLLIRYAVHNVLAGAERSGPAAVVFKHAYHPDEIVLFLGLGQSDSIQTAIDLLGGQLAWTRRHLGISVSVGVGSVREALLDLPISYVEAKQALRNRLLHPDHSIFVDAKESRETPIYCPMIDNPLQKMLLCLLEEGKYEEFISGVEPLFRSLTDSPDTRYSQFEQLYLEVVYVWRMHMAQTGASLSGQSLTDPIAELQELNVWTDILDVVRRQLYRLTPALSSRHEQQSGDDLILSVKQYADRHYTENLSLQWISETYFIHPNYFSKRFKQIVGTSFSDYVTRMRIGRAKELLKTTTFKIARIAQLVGYEDQNYFCNVFKKSTSLSPSAYRDRG